MPVKLKKILKSTKYPKFWFLTEILILLKLLLNKYFDFNFESIFLAKFNSLANSLDKNQNFGEKLKGAQKT